MSHDPLTIDSEQRWWLAVDGRPDGPFTTGYVSTALQAGRLSAMSLVCPQGDAEWKPLAAWPGLAKLADSVAAVPPPPLPPSSPPPSPPPFPGSVERLLTNVLLPPMANVICVYAIVVVPLYWMFGFAMLLREDNPFLAGTGCYLANGANVLLNQLVTLALTIVLAVAGIRLRDLRTSGERFVRLSLSVWLAWSVIQILVFFGLMIVGVVHEAVEDSSEAVSAGDIFHLFVVLVFWLCDIVAVIWLFRRRDRLPLDSHR